MLQIYTSGTSGRPKGVLLTDRNLAAKVTGVIERWGLDEESTSLLATPLFHVGALSWGLVGLAAGATTILADDARPATIARHLEDERVTHAFLVPSMLAALAREVGRADGRSRTAHGRLRRVADQRWRTSSGDNGSRAGDCARSTG